MQRDTSKEERRAPRVRSKGSARVGDGRHWAHGRIVDLSTAGVRITTEQAWPEGQPLHIELSFDAAPTTHFTLTGRARRSTADQLAIELDAVSTEVERFIVEELVAAAMHDGAPNVILVDAKSPKRSAIAEAFRRHGWVVTEVSTPLEAIRQLIDERFDPSVIAIADTFPESVAEDLREFLSDEYPDAHMIAIGKSPAVRDPAGSWLSSGDAHRDLDKRVGRIVTSHGARARPLTARPRIHRCN